MYLDDAVKRVIMGFAKSEPLITAVYRQSSNGNKSPTYFMLIKGRFNHQLQDRITELDLMIANSIKYDCDIIALPPSVEFFNSKDCIWKRF